VKPSLVDLRGMTARRSSPAILPALAAAATGIQVGSAIVATRFVVNQTGPASLALLRYVIGFCCLAPLVLASGRMRFERRDLLPIAFLGIVQFGVLIALLNYALRFIPSARAAVIFATTPLLTMILAAALGHERLTPPRIWGVSLTIAGVVFVLGEQAIQRGAASGAGERLGEMAAFASALSGAICSVSYRPYVRKYATLQVSALAMLASIGFLAALAVGEGFFVRGPHFTTAGWLAVLFIGAGSGLGYYLWLWALAHTTPTQVTVFLALSPLTAAALGMWLLAERLSAQAWFGVAFVLLGLWLAHRPFPGDREEGRS
jgi:drug/metabolite transporter (DMT)-like permease